MDSSDPVWRKTILTAEIDLMQRRLVAFKAWAHRPPQRIPALEELALTDPKWTE
jgi:hypothetical protein